jgi:hypothetical protein
VVLHRGDVSTHEHLDSQLGLTRQQLEFRLDSPQQQYPYLCLSQPPPDFALDPALDCTFSLICRAALRHFARKLFGFESSSPGHLYQNFLSGLSEIRRMDQRLEVRLPASPLSLVLRMADFRRRSGCHFESSSFR